MKNGEKYEKYYYFRRELDLVTLQVDNYLDAIAEYSLEEIKTIGLSTIDNVEVRLRIARNYLEAQCLKRK